MAAAGNRFSLNLMGSFRLLGPEGQRINIANRKAVAIVAMLAMAEGGERTRGWLQEKLWGRRDRTQAQGSLRRELTLLREHLNIADDPALICERQTVRLDLAQFDIDAAAPRPAGTTAGEFLEGFDLAGEEGFEDWLREQRMVLAARPVTGPASLVSPPARSMPRPPDSSTGPPSPSCPSPT